MMTSKEVKKALSKCEVVGTKLNYTVYYPINKNVKLKDVIEYIETTITNVDIGDTQVYYIDYYKGKGVRNKSHYAVKIKLSENSKKI